MKRITLLLFAVINVAGVMRLLHATVPPPAHQFMDKRAGAKVSEIAGSHAADRADVTVPLIRVVVAHPPGH